MKKLNLNFIDFLMSGIVFYPLGKIAFTVPLKAHVIPRPVLAYMFTYILICLSWFIRIVMIKIFTGLMEVSPSPDYKSGIFSLYNRDIKSYFYEMPKLYAFLMILLCNLIYIPAGIILGDMVSLMGHGNYGIFLFFLPFSVMVNAFMITAAYFINNIWKNDDLRTLKDPGKISEDEKTYLMDMMQENSQETFNHAVSYLKPEDMDTPVRLSEEIRIADKGYTARIMPGEYTLKTSFKAVNEDVKYEDIIRNIKNKKGSLMWFEVRSVHHINGYEITKGDLEKLSYNYSAERMFSEGLSKSGKTHMLIWETFKKI